MFKIVLKSFKTVKHLFAGYFFPANLVAFEKQFSRCRLLAHFYPSIKL